MGNLGSVPADCEAMALHSVVERFFNGGKSASSTATQLLRQKPPKVLRAYVDTCRAYGAVLHQQEDSPVGPQDFAHECRSLAPSIHRMFHRKGQRKFVHRGIMYFVLTTPVDIKLFAKHLKGIELIQFLNMPDVVVPESALTQFMGLHIACIRLTYLHQPVQLDPSLTSGNATNVLSWTSRHSAIVRMVIGKVLRLKNEAALALYEMGDGRIVVVDAVSLLPELCIEPANGNPWHSMRAEYLVGRDLGALYAVSGIMIGQTTTTTTPTSSQKDAPFPSSRSDTANTQTPSSYLAAVVQSAASRKRTLNTPTLNALIALQCQGTLYLSDTMSVAGVPLSCSPRYMYITHHAPHFIENATMTSHVFAVVLPALVEIIETLSDDIGASEFVGLLHLAGVGIHTLGEMYNITRRRQSPAAARDRIVNEMVSRAAKRWLLGRMLVDSAMFEEHTIALFRGMAEPSFFESDLMPWIEYIFGQRRPDWHLPLFQEVPFRMVFDRVQKLTGVSISQGKLKSISPVVRVARRDFTLSSSDETSVCGVAARRADGLAGAAMFAAASWWGTNPNRLSRIVEQLLQKVRANLALPQQSEGMILTQLFLTELQFYLSRLVLNRLDRDGAKADPAEQQKRFEYAQSVLCDYVPQISQLYCEAAHDRLHVARQILPLIEFQLKDQMTAPTGTRLLRLLLQLGLLSDPSQHHAVASRGVADDLYRLSIEACILTKQSDEALVVAQRWAKLCPSLFGTYSKQNCRATKLLLSALVLTRSSKGEQHRVAKTQVQLCEKVYGPRDARTAAAISELGSLTWKMRPHLGLQYFRKSLEVYKETLGAASRPVCSAMYNIGLALARVNKFMSALLYLSQAKHLAAQLGEHSTAHMCEVSEGTVRGVAALKIQRWYRELRYGQAQSQTTKTDVTTKCSTLSWSDERDEIASSVND